MLLLCRLCTMTGTCCSIRTVLHCHSCWIVGKPAATAVQGKHKFCYAGFQHQSCSYRQSCQACKRVWCRLGSRASCPPGKTLLCTCPASVCYAPCLLVLRAGRRDHHRPAWALQVNVFKLQSILTVRDPCISCFCVTVSQVFLHD